MRLLLILSTTFIVSGAVQAARWNKSNNPEYFRIIVNRGEFNYELNLMATSAKLKDDRFGWSESYWPSMLGGIAYRWNHPEPQPFEYKLHTKEELLKMSEDQISRLSPAELYDISQGDYKYRLTKKVLRTYSSDDLWWEGICHGWAQAASNYPEPAPVTIKNKDGIKVPFGSSDIKGLLSMHDAYNSKGLYARIGDRCAVEGKVAGEGFVQDGDIPPPSKEDAEREECADVNAGAFHVVLVNMISKYSKGFVADVDRFNDVWNQPIIGYDSEVSEEANVPLSSYRQGVERKIRVVTKMHYGDELDFYSAADAESGDINFVSKKPVTGTPHQLITSREYEYYLELDSDNKIIGGEWISESRPDMLWMKTADEKFRDGKFPLEGLNQIYRPVQR